MRIKEHPILGKEPNAKKIKILFEGKEIVANEDEPIATALMNAGIMDFRRTRVLGEARGVYCAIGRCTDCMMIVDGQPNVRTCITPAKDGMTVERGK